MADCPVHDAPFSDPGNRRVEILLRIKDPILIATLACNVAEHTIGLAHNPAQAREWLAAARAWQDVPEGLKPAGEKAREQTACAGQPGVAQDAIAAVSWAIRTALWARARTYHLIEDIDFRGLKEAQTSAARSVLAHAVLASGEKDSEKDWQLQHMIGLACICPKAAPHGGRLRTSLLAR